MTRAELAAQIDKDIKQKGRTEVPIGILLEVLSVDVRASTTNDATLEEFAGNHGWRVRYGNDLPTSRVIFYPADDPRTKFLLFDDLA